MQNLLLVLMVIIVLAVPFGTALATAEARPGQPVLVLALPWIHADHLLASLGATDWPEGGRLIGRLVVFDGPVPQDRLNAAGAMALGLTGLLALICGEGA